MATNPKAGQVTVTTAGTAVQGTAVVGHLFSICAHPDNTDSVWIGNTTNDVTNLIGYPLIAGGGNIVVEIGNLNLFWFDANVSGEKVCWIQLD